MSTFLVSRRAERGEKPKHLRQQGLIPIVVIDRAHQPHAVKAPLSALRAAVRGADSHGVIELQIEGEPDVRKAMLKAIDGNTMARQVLCATFQEVNSDDMVKVDVSVVATGHIAEGEGDENVMLTTVTSVLHVRGKVSDLPDHIEVDVSKIALGEHLSASDIALPAGIELLSSPDVVLFTVSRVAAPVLEADETTEATAATEDAAGGTEEDQSSPSA